ncbi:MAG: hypothetical protein R3B93_24280 [Bacteroidia bacterium]
MTPVLRKRHLRIWVILAFLLPMGFISAFFEKPDKIIVAESGNDLAPALRDILRESEDDQLKVNVRSESFVSEIDSTELSRYQLEIIIKEPLTAPSNQVYLSLDETKQSIEGKLLLGNLGPRGIYRFDLKNMPEVPEKLYLILYDGIKNQTLKTIVL